ncbi:hypothetical protein R3X27_03580 [Tropicimonas sp. TH_r6]|uniref:helix-turn-helix domain-containing protein n=1 Tax=Tropicimonas sp. TH_r6 TaxID=3082085 RepID=UPI0029535AF7|nr:helix-turn-helix domain-containing protein [Tropicimonas sp. TH_r6]MDV7141757.1 hypothetical protein [Tropicimonas sp. TH_r6]
MRTKTIHSRHKNAPTNIVLAKPEHELLSRQRLFNRWQKGSDAFFWRAERDGLLPGYREGRLIGYRWPDVFDFEGGQPPEGLEGAYREDLYTVDDVVALTPYCRDTIIGRAKAGALPFRRVGKDYLFVPEEVLRWLRRWS